MKKLKIAGIALISWILAGGLIFHQNEWSFVPLIMQILLTLGFMFPFIIAYVKLEDKSREDTGGE